jgi:OOP family OmpA-OmpF porin
MKKKRVVLLAILGLIVPALIATQLQAAEIVTEDDVKLRVVRQDHLIQIADNAIVLFDASGSMAKPYKNTGMTRMEAAKETLKRGAARVPAMGFNAGLYLFTPWRTLSRMQPFNRAEYVRAVDSLPEPRQDVDSPLAEGIMNLDPILAGLRGHTAVFIFSDGTFTYERRFKRYPPTEAKKLADKYDVKFILISSAETEAGKKVLKEIADVNAASRVIPIDWMLDRPDYNSGAIYVVKSTLDLETVTEQKIVGIRIDDTHFDLNKATVRPQSYDELDEMGAFLRNNRKAYAVLEGYTDSSGSEEYNLALSRRRAESVAGYLMDNWKIEPFRIVVFWYGELNPVASNDTREGRKLNRRVEAAIGGL